MRDLERMAAETLGPILFRLVWWNSLDPSMRGRFASDLLEAFVLGAMRTYEADARIKLNEAHSELVRRFIRSSIESETGGFAKHITDFGDESYETIVRRTIESKNRSRLHQVFANQYDAFTSRIANLSTELISAVKIINEEFVIWLKTHASDTKQIHSDAFEQLTGEILTSHGFEIAFTGRIKNRSADLVAIQRNENGTETKYLVECKRYDESNRVGINIFNAVIGASVRARTSHAMLVTTSSFTGNVIDANSELVDFRLELHDGQRVIEWLNNYQFKDFGLWLPEGWRDPWSLSS